MFDWSHHSIRVLAQAVHWHSVPVVAWTGADIEDYNLLLQIIITDEDTFVRVVGSGGGASVRAVDVRVVVVST